MPWTTSGQFRDLTWVWATAGRPTTLPRRAICDWWISKPHRPSPQTIKHIGSKQSDTPRAMGEPPRAPRICAHYARGDSWQGPRGYRADYPRPSRAIYPYVNAFQLTLDFGLRM